MIILKKTRKSYPRKDVTGQKFGKLTAIEWLRGGRPLKFDFAIFNNGELKRLVEFNGIQHYERPKGSWADGYETLLEHDRRKIEYCNKNNIELKIISYKDKYNLTDIID